MNEVKPHLSYEGQINKLREKGCIIDDDSFCRNVLVNIGYYRLSAYFLPFKSFDGTYMDNLSFKRVYRVYEFDRKLRNLLFSAIEVIEVSLRTRLAHFHSEKYGALGYLDASSFNSKHNADKFKLNIDREIENNKKQPSLELLQKYANIYGVRLSSLILLSENMEEAEKAGKGTIFIKNMMAHLIQSMSNIASDADEE